MKKRIVSMDVLRCISTLAVVMIHVTATILSSNKVNSRIYRFCLILNQLSRFSVPAFIFLSGMGLSMVYKKKSNYFTYELRRINKILPDYIIWCFIYFYFVINKMNFKDLVEGIFDGKIYYHLYYIPIIIVLYIMFPLCFKFLKSKKVVLLSFIITSTITMFNYMNYNKGVSINFGRGNIFNWIFYFILGSNIGLNYKKCIYNFKKYNKLIFLSLCLYTPIILIESFIGVENNIDHSTTFVRPSIILFSIIVIVFILGINFKSNKFIKVISKNSYIIYLSHPLILYYTKKCFQNNNYDILSKRFFLVGYFNCIILGMVISIIVNKFKKIYKSHTIIIKQESRMNFPT